MAGNPPKAMRFRVRGFTCVYDTSHHRFITFGQGSTHTEPPRKPQTRKAKMENRYVPRVSSSLMLTQD